MKRISEERIRDVLEHWPAYADADLDAFEPRNDAQANAIAAIRRRPAGSYFIRGRYGAGKTRILIAQYKYLALAGSACILRSAKDLMAELQKAETRDAGQPYVSEVLRRTHEAKPGGLHLFIDDIEAAPARSEFRQEAVFDVFDRVWKKQLGLTITSNMPLKDLDAKGVLTSKAAARILRVREQIEL